MVRNLLDRSNWRVVVKSYTIEGESVIGVLNDANPLDAFDYAIQAQGYFRFAIREMPCLSIGIELIDHLGSGVEFIEITRD